MKFSILNLVTVDQCDTLLSDAADQKLTLTAKKVYAEHAISRFLEKDIKLKADLEMLASELELLKSIINQVSGPLASQSIERKLVLEYKMLLLTNSSVAYSTEKLLDKELKLAIIVQQIAVIESFISGIEKRKAELK